jgi:hypothetical protein
MVNLYRGTSAREEMAALAKARQQASQQAQARPVGALGWVGLALSFAALWGVLMAVGALSLKPFTA